jgi:hypothetical protein
MALRLSRRVHSFMCSATQATNERTAAKGFELSEPSPMLITPYPDLSFIQAHFTFTTEVASCVGVANIVQYKGAWKAWTVCTTLEQLKDYPEKPRPLGTDRKYTTWQEQREHESEFESEDPTVLIGAGQAEPNLPVFV